MFKSANKALRLACMFSFNGKESVLEYISSLLFTTIILLFKEIEKKTKKKMIIRTVVLLSKSNFNNPKSF